MIFNPSIRARTCFHITYHLVASSLRLTIPCAYDFARINSCMPDTVALRLRHLYMEIIDGTGPGGDNEYTHHWQGDDDDGDEDHPFSNVQLQFPNVDHFSGMCGLANRCKSLESLALVGTQRINLETLDFQSTNGGLKNVYLSRVLCTAEKLLTLLPSNSTEGTPGNIEAFTIEESALWDGTWEVVLARLLEAPSLLHVRVYNLIYSKHGLSSNYHEFNNRVWENASEIWTENEADRERLGQVLKAVQNRGYALEDDMQEYVKVDTMNHQKINHETVFLLTTRYQSRSMVFTKSRNFDIHGFIHNGIAMKHD